MMAFSAEGGKKEQEGACAARVRRTVSHASRDLQGQGRWSEGTSGTSIDAAAAAAASADRGIFIA